MSTNLINTTLNIIAGIIVIALDRLSIFLWKKYKAGKFKEVFGQNIDNYFIIYGKLILRPVVTQQFEYPYIKPGQQGAFKTSSPIPYSETLSAKYLSESFSQILRKSPKLVADDVVHAELNVSFTSLGGLHNLKTIDVLNSPNNQYFRFDTNHNPVTIVSIPENEHFNNTPTHNLGIIVKIHNPHFPNQVQICVAGLGEPGTTGAAWFLAHKWKEIQEKCGDKDFGILIRVENNRDQSSEIIKILTQ